MRLKKYEFDVAFAQATLLIYFRGSIGIGEHPQQLEEMDKLVQKLTDAKNRLEKLLKQFDTFSPTQKSNIIGL